MAGRPRSFDRDAALAVAVEQFWRTGYEETSIASLTQAMGITPPSLYAAFGDKERLFVEASQAYFSLTCDGVDAALAHGDLHAAIADLLHRTARAHTGEDTPPGCLMLTEPRLAPQRQVVQDKLRTRLERGVADGDLPPETSTDYLARYLVAVMRGMSGCARDGGDGEDVLAIVRSALAALPHPVRVA